LELAPRDKDAQAGLLAAQTAKKKADFERCMAQGKTAITENRLIEAVKQFEAAVVLFPTNALARKNLDAAKRRWPTPHSATRTLPAPCRPAGLPLHRRRGPSG
jgi:Flp pilus assembly protein TadD